MIRGIAPAGADGRTSFTVQIPAGLTPGAHRLVVTSEGLTPIEIPITVTAAGGLATTGGQAPLAIALTGGLLLLAGGLALALRRRGASVE